MKKVLLLVALTLIFSACTQDMVDDVIDSIPFLGGDEEIQRAVDLGKPGECEKLKNDDANQELRRKNQCFERVAEKINDPQVCKMIVGDSNRWNNCFKSVASGVKKPELCEEIQDDERVKGNCYSDIAIAMNDESYCGKDKDTFDQNKCYTEIAKNKKDESVCDNMENNNNRSTCYATVAIEATNVEICNKIDFSAINKVRCINGVAGKANDINICDEQEDREDRYICISIVAEDNNNLSLCDKISDQEESERCVKEIAKKKRDETLCEGLEEIMRDLCYSQVGEAKNDVSVCDKTNSSYFRSDCYKNIAAKTGEMDLCLSMNMEDSYRSGCLLEASKKGDSSDACKKLEGEGLYNCALNVAKYQRNARYCGLAIASQGTREKCIHEVVAKYKDAKVCEPITDPGDKDKCLNSLKFVE